jgi:DNA-binding MarR family transcriptional regulator
LTALDLIEQSADLATDPSEQSDAASLRRDYLDLTRAIERLHRRFLDVLRAELTRLGLRELNGVQALLLSNIGDEEITIRDLIERGYYQGSNVSYNIKKLTEMGFLVQRRADHDRRSVTIVLTDKARAVVEHIRRLEERIAGSLAEHDLDSSEINSLCRALRRLEGVWTEVIHYGRT